MEDKQNRIPEFYHAARKLHGEERSRYLAEVCGPDAAMRRQIQALLHEDENADSLLDRPAVRLAGELMTAPAPSWSPGALIGPYEIGALLGRGGMGEVYRARDTRLNRSVAIKVLPPHLAGDAQFGARFEREARAVAALNHPHICTLYDVGQLGLSTGSTPAIDFLVMEYLEGETLAQRLKRGPLSLAQSLQYATEIADALDKAHRAGITHRDLKPGNIMITKSGTKVLDFGLAKSAGDETLTGSLAVMGTPAYMAPEQHQGKQCDARTDIYAFGLILFEMVTGKRFSQDEPSFAGVPEKLEHVIADCLDKEPDERWQTAADLKKEITWSAKQLASPSRSRPAEISSKGRTILLAFLIVPSIVMGLAVGVLFRRDVPATVWSGTLLGGPAIAFGPRASRDGKIAFQALIDGQTQVGVMDPKSGDSKLLTHVKNEGQIVVLCWSADGTKIYFDLWDGTPLGVFSIPALGGDPRSVIRDAGILDTLPDGDLILVRLNSDSDPHWQLYRFKPNREETPLNAFSGARRARAFPDGKQIVFYGQPADSSEAALGLYILDLATNTSRPIGPELNLSSDGRFGLAVDPVDKSVLVDTKKGDLHQIISIPSDGKNPVRELLPLTGQTNYMDATADGALYLDQVVRPVQALRFTESAQLPEQLNTVPEGYKAPILELPDGRLLLTDFFDGRSRLLVTTKSTGELIPFVDTNEDTRGPVTFAGPGQVAFVLGKHPRQSIALASTKDGRLIRRLSIISTDSIQSLTASSDGSTFFYSDARSIWSMASTGGDARKLGPGDSVAFDPRHQSLIVEFIENDGGRLGRMPLTGGPAQTISTINRELRMIDPLGPNAVRADGQIVVTVTARNSWFYGNAVVNPESGELRRIPLRYDADLHFPSWNQKNEIVTGSRLMRSSIWRFRPKRN